MEEEVTVHKVKKDEWMQRKVSKTKSKFETAFYLIAASLIYSTAFHYFVAPANFAPGGIGGVLAMVQFYFKDFEQVSAYSPLLIILLNLPLLMPAWKHLSKEFAIRSAIITLLMTGMLFLLDNVIDKSYRFSIYPPNGVPIDVGTRLVAALIGGALCGVSLACALKINASTGGADIVGALIQKRNPHKSVATMIFAVNAVIMAISILVYKEQLMPVFLSVIYLFVSTKMCDLLMQGSKSGLKFEVVTEHAQEISEEIIDKLGHGVTVCPAEGMFDQKNKFLLICIIKPRQVAKFRDIINAYPDTFAYVGQVNEIYGKFNKGGK